VGAGSNVDSWLGEPEWSDLAGPPFVKPSFADPDILDDDAGWLGALAEYSRDSCIRLRFCSASNRAARSALIDCFAK
jgi:hypothetical protein